MATKKRGRGKKRKNLTQLLKEMEKLSIEPNDREICRRFKLLIETNDDLDISRSVLTTLLEDYKNVKDEDIPEAVLPFARHYIFMRKRAKK